MPAVQLLIQGEVQGVFYRASAREQAAALGLTGWVRNTPEGDVACLASGPEAALEEFVAWCRRGPAGARVTGVLVLPAEEGEPCTDFRIVY